MKTIIGIGNPDKKYQNTRHNAGKMLIDNLDKNNFRLFKSDKYMNQSGEFIENLVSSNPNVLVSNLYIAHDDLDIPLGGFKITKKSPKEHNGIKSINNALGESDYWKIRIGVDNRDPENRANGEDYVLEDFSGQELKILNGVFKKINKELNG